MGQTIAEKILSKKIGKAKYKAGDVVFIEPDIAMLYWPGFDGMVREININPDKVIINVDHFFIQRDEEQAKVLRNFRITARKYGLNIFTMLAAAASDTSCWLKKAISNRASSVSIPTPT